MIDGGEGESTIAAKITFFPVIFGLRLKYLWILGKKLIEKTTLGLKLAFRYTPWKNVVTNEV